MRFAYLETAVAMLARECGDDSLLPGLESAREQMVLRHSSLPGALAHCLGLKGLAGITSSIPSMPTPKPVPRWGTVLELGDVALTGAAKYGDLFEWQLYNAAAVGMGLDGKSYLYNNPLTAHGEVQRRPWFAVPCAPPTFLAPGRILKIYLPCGAR